MLKPNGGDIVAPTERAAYRRREAPWMGDGFNDERPKLAALWIKDDIGDATDWLD